MTKPISGSWSQAFSTTRAFRPEPRVTAIKRGAYDFIEKPFKSDRLILVATRALETSRLKREVKELKQLAPTASILTGRSPCMNQLRQTIDRAAKANSRILIVGPSGSGKDRKSTRLNSSHMSISYAVFCLKKKKKKYYGYFLKKKKNK